MPDKIKIIWNPISGHGIGKKNVPAIAEYLTRAGFSVSELQTQKKGDAREAAASVDKSFYAVICVGGDGTLNEVLNGLGSRGVPLAVFPAGTGNVFWHEIRTPREVEPFCRMVEHGYARRFDVGEVGRTVESTARFAPSTSRPQEISSSLLFNSLPSPALRPEAAGRRFICMTGIGFDAAVVRKLERMRWGNMVMAMYAFPITQCVMDYSFATFTVEIDGKVVSKTAGGAIVSNTRSYGGPIDVALKADPFDGLLDVCIMERATLVTSIKHISKIVFKRHLEDRDIKYVRGASIKLRSHRRVPLQVDGDSAGFLPVDISIYPADLPVILQE